MALFSNWLQSTSKFDKNISDTLSCALCASFFLFLSSGYPTIPRAEPLNTGLNAICIAIPLFSSLAHCRVFSLYSLFSSLSLSAKSSARVFSEEQIYDDVDISLTLPLKSVIFKMMFTSERTRNLGHINIYNYVMLARSCFKTSRAFGLA